MGVERLDSKARTGKLVFPWQQSVHGRLLLDTVLSPSLHELLAMTHMGMFLFRPRLCLPLLILGVLNRQTGKRFDSSPGKFFFSFPFFQTTLRGFRKYKTKWEKYRLKGGIEPLRLSSATGLKPALRTTEDHQGEKRVSVRVANFVENITGRYLWLVVKPHLI